MTTINPYLTFPGNCREAMTFYQECLGGELTLQSVAESPMASQWPREVQHNILHSSLMKNTMMIMGSDMAGAEGIQKGNQISLSLTCHNINEAKDFFNNLARGGQVVHSLHEFFNGTIGALIDKYGMTWMLFCPKTKPVELKN